MHTSLGSTFWGAFDRFYGWRRSKFRRRLFYLVLAAFMLASILTPLTLAGASTLQVYEHIRQLGTAGVAPLLHVKDLFLKSHTTTSSAHAGAASAACTGTPTPGGTATPTASPATPTPIATPGIGSGLPIPISSSTLNEVDFKAFTDPDKLNQAYSDFVAARNNFAQLAAELDSHPTLFQLAGLNPSYARQISEARAIARVGLDISTLGEEVTTTALTI